jgi:hypothetical protein
MATVTETVELVAGSATWDERIARIRQIPARHGTDDRPSIYAQIARRLYVPHLTPDYAYVNMSDFYELSTFESAYTSAATLTESFTKVTEPDLAHAIQVDPRALLPLRVITGLTRGEFADSTALVAEPMGLKALSANKVDSMERGETKATSGQARVVAAALDNIIRGTLFSDPTGTLRSKQEKPDTERGWESVQRFAGAGVPYALFLHQRHYGGSYRQVLDATSEQRGNTLEDAVETLFKANGILNIRTGSHNQAEVASRFEVTVQPAPDFVVFDQTGSLRAMLECKGANDGGTARDKALRFGRLQAEASRLGGIPLVAVLGGLGWKRVNDTLGPVVRDCDGRVFSVSNIDEMLTVAPFASLAGT